jgi:hypothetical protein
MIQLKDQNSWLPYNAQVYEDKENSITIKGQTLNLLVMRYRNELRSRGLPVPEDLEQRILKEISKKYPNCCSYIDENPPEVRIKKNFNINDVKAFLKSVEGTIRSGGVVSQEVAEERTNICMRCPYNKGLPGCEGCSGVANIVFSIIGARKTNNLGYLKQCGICGCSLKAKVWVPQETIKETAQIQNNANDFPDWCWVRKEQAGG